MTPVVRARFASAFVAAVLASALAGASLIGQAPAQPAPTATDPQVRLKWFDQHLAMKEASPFKGLSWQFLGPTNISGRVTDVAVVTPRGKSYTIYVATATGGVWKTDNDGVTWTPVFDQGVTTSIGDVTLAPSNPDIVWVGTGEANIFRSSNAGAGAFKSTDGGRTWRHAGLAATLTIARIVVHPSNPDIVYVAASGHEWTDNEERGVYKTTDGGATWRRVHHINPRTGAIDLVMDPSNPNVLYASTWQRIRRKWNDPRNEAGYGESGIYKSTDAGETWAPINAGLPPAASRGRIGLDIARSRPGTLYAFVDNYEIARKAKEGERDAYGRQRADIIKGAEVYRSDDSGATWRKVTESNAYMEGLAGTYGWVFGQIRVDPTNENTVYVMGLALNVSRDGGKTFQAIGDMHGDHHALWIDPDNPNFLVNGNDGGVVVSYDQGRNWREFLDNLPVVQFFNASFDMDTPFRVYGSIQDHGSRRAVVDLSRGRDRIPAQAFQSAPGGEGSRHAIDPRNPNVVYSAGFYHNINRADVSRVDARGRAQSVSITPPPPPPPPPRGGSTRAGCRSRGVRVRRGHRVCHAEREARRRCAAYIWKSTDFGATWKSIAGNIPLGPVNVIAEDPTDARILYAGTDIGVYVTLDGGGTWSVLGGNLPSTYVHDIVIHPRDRMIVAATHGRGMWVLDAVPVQSAKR